MMTGIKNKLMATAASVSTAIMLLPMSVSANATATTTTAPNFDNVAKPIEELIRSLVAPALTIVGALGALYCILLGAKFAKAEEPQEREKAKSHLKNAIIGFVLIFVLLLVLSRAMPSLISWVTNNQGNATGL